MFGTVQIKWYTGNMSDHPLLMYYSAVIQLCMLLNVFYSRCLVGDSSGKSFGDVAFMEHHNLESNIERKMYALRNVIGINLIGNMCDIFDVQVYTAVAGQRVGSLGTLSCFAAMAVGLL